MAIINGNSTKNKRKQEREKKLNSSESFYYSGIMTPRTHTVFAVLVGVRVQK